MFLKKSSQDEYAIDLETKLHEVETAPMVEKQANQQIAIAHLLRAADMFEAIGLTKQAAIVTAILERFAQDSGVSDVAVNGLTDEKMIHNLEETGWVFNAPNDAMEEPLEVSDAPEIEDTLFVTSK